jgi:hypothetical protein
MCENCWREHGAPTIDNERVHEFASLVNAIYETEVTGAPLHIQLADWNIDRDWAPYAPARDHLVAPAAWDTATKLSSLAVQMTVAERSCGDPEVL